MNNSPAPQMARELMECLQKWGLSHLEAKEVARLLQQEIATNWKGRLI